MTSLRTLTGLGISKAGTELTLKLRTGFRSFFLFLNMSTVMFLFWATVKVRFCRMLRENSLLGGSFSRLTLVKTEIGLLGRPDTAERQKSH